MKHRAIALELDKAEETHIGVRPLSTRSEVLTEEDAWSIAAREIGCGRSGARRIAATSWAGLLR